MQSSGKSTLLNALFGCKFAVSVGRCTRGLFLRLLYLDKSLAESLKVDAFLIVDTEGLGAPEKMNDPDADKKDRMLATFVIGISNLVVINVLGEYMSSLTEILQIAIVSMARLEEAEISPDILLVQHLNESNESKLQASIHQFCEAIKSAIDLVDKKFLNAGVKNSNAVLKLMDRIRKRELLKIFRPFKSGASVFSQPSEEYHEDVQLFYETLIDAARGNAMPFAIWQKSVKSYWDAVEEEDFATRFKNIKQFNEFIERGNQISKVKEALERAFRHHIEDDIMPWLIREQVKRFQDNSLSDLEIKQARTEIEQEIVNRLKKIPKSCKLKNKQMSCEFCSSALQEENVLLNLVADKDWDTKSDIKKTIRDAIDTLFSFHFTTVKQRFDALLLNNECSNEFMAIIDNWVKKELIKKNQNFEETAIAKIVDKIWNELEAKASSMVNIRPVNELILEEIGEEYQFKDIKTDFQKNVITCDMLRKKKAVKYFDYKVVEKIKFLLRPLLPEELSFFLNIIDNLTNEILETNRIEHFQKGKF